MKNNLFELLFNLFEKSLTQLQKDHESNDTIALEDGEALLSNESQDQCLKSAQNKSIRVLTCSERIKLTKASYQFLMRMRLWNIVDSNQFECILHQLQFSDSRIVSLKETKWTVRNVLAIEMNEKQLTFLDLVLYRIEDDLTTH